MGVLLILVMKRYLLKILKHTLIWDIRPKRDQTQPKRLNNFIVELPPSVDHAHCTSTQGAATVHPITNYLSYNIFLTLTKPFLSAITTTDEPKTFKQGTQDPNCIEAMKKEIQALEKTTHGLLSLCQRENEFTRSNTSQMGISKHIKRDSSQKGSFKSK